MKRRFFSVLTLALFACTLSFSFAYAAETITVPAQYANKKIIIVDNAYVYPEDITLANAEYLKLNTLDNAIADLRSGKAEAIIYDANVLKYVAASNPDLVVLDDVYFGKGMVFAINPGMPELKRAVDGKIAAMQANGQLDNMRNYWFSAAGQRNPMPEVIITPNASDSSRNITYGTVTNHEPFAFIGNDPDVIGYDIEMVMYVAQSQEAQLFVETMEPQQLLPAVREGRVDMAGGFMAGSPALTDVLVSEPYFGGGLAMMVLKK